jgi:hypothetical protein
MELIFKIVSYACMSLGMDIGYTALAKVFDKKPNPEDAHLIGQTSLWMTLYYVVMFILIFEPLSKVIAPLFIVYRYLIWGAVIISAEFLFGLFLDKVFKVRLWDFRGIKGNIMGYTISYLFFLWGVVGLFMEIFTALVNHLSVYGIQFLVNIDWMKFLKG